MLKLDSKYIAFSDLKAFQWCTSFHYSLKSINKLTLEKDVDILLKLDFYDELQKYFWNRKIDVTDHDNRTHIWYYHFWFFLTIFGYRAKDYASRLPFYFWTPDDGGNLYLVYNGQKTNDFDEVYDAFNKLLKYWFAIPPLINDFYKFNLENNFSTKLEDILFKHWIQLPGVIHELRSLTLQFEPEKLIPRGLFYYELWRPWSDVKFYEAWLDFGYSDVSYLRFVWFSKLHDEKDFYPQTKNVIKVYKEKGSNLPETVSQLMDLYKEGLKDWDEDVKYFFQFFEDNNNFITESIIPEAISELLVYNPPFPISLLRAIFPQTEEELDAWASAKEEWERRYFQD